MLKRSLGVLVTITLILVVAVSSAQQGDPRRGAGPDTLPDTPQVLGTAEQRFRVVPIKGLVRPSALAFLPNGDILVAERPGRLRIVHEGVVDPQPISGMPTVNMGSTTRLGLWDMALHPRFADNRLIYFTYLNWNANENVPPESRPSGTSVLGRGRFDGGHRLTDVKDLFVSNAWTDGFTAAKIAFAPDGKIFMSIGMPIRDKAHGGGNRVGTADQAQDPSSHAGKVLRLNDDGTVPSDNPFVGKPGYQPEIYALGFRNPLGLMIHPQTGELWDAEHGPQGGDEVNIIKAGRNYGWPVISLGRSYSGDLTGISGPERAEPCAPGMEQPFLFWVPVIGPGGMTVYTGDKFPAWKGNLFIGGQETTQLHRVVFNQRGLPTRREALLTELKQRIRDVKQGPDGLLYLVTDHETGALLKIEPVVETSAR